MWVEPDVDSGVSARERVQSGPDWKGLTLGGAEVLGEVAVVDDDIAKRVG